MLKSEPEIPNATDAKDGEPQDAFLDSRQGVAEHFPTPTRSQAQPIRVARPESICVGRCFPTPQVWLPDIRIAIAGSHAADFRSWRQFLLFSSPTGKVRRNHK
jgi:hypothetical protein